MKYSEGRLCSSAEDERREERREDAIRTGCGTLLCLTHLATEGLNHRRPPGSHVVPQTSLLDYAYQTYLGFSNGV